MGFSALWGVRAEGSSVRSRGSARAPPSSVNRATTAAYGHAHILPRPQAPGLRAWTVSLGPPVNPVQHLSVGVSSWGQGGVGDADLFTDRGDLGKGVVECGKGRERGPPPVRCGHIEFSVDTQGN